MKVKRYRKRKSINRTESWRNPHGGRRTRIHGKAKERGRVEDGSVFVRGAMDRSTARLVHIDTPSFAMNAAFPGASLMRFRECHISLALEYHFGIGSLFNVFRV